MRHILLNITLLLLTTSCGQTQQPNNKDYPKYIGDISFDETLDDANFKVCNENRVSQYYAFDMEYFKGEKPAIINFFQKNYDSRGHENEDGYVTIRFIVNCEGETGRFRIQEMDFEYNSKKFNTEITKQLLQLTKKLDAWQRAQYNGQHYDYYYYLTFRIVQGEIKLIMP